ncbi:hypothetical protein [Streptomyces sp. NPDC059176]|uniref:hypothetical protein n=1 Tax=unclassified Streptomyces TaxID=2593676 RepID=UPI0036AB4050
MDASGRRAKTLRRAGILVGVLCLGYAAVLGLVFLGWGTWLAPSSVLPVQGEKSTPEGGHGPRGHLGKVRPAGKPAATRPPNAPPSSSPSLSASVSASEAG